ncbi:MAG: hypothetical protein IKQ41_13560 [Clostridia bacterium]|nr:hypothetical protein [Clostridia bacterium]
MKSKHGAMIRKTLSLLALAVMCVFILSACGSDPYAEYAAAYNKVTANGGMDADLKAALTMDGKTTNCSGNFKVDTKSNIMYYEMSTDDQVVTQYSDGSYLYTDQDGHKTKYSLNAKPAQNTAQDKQGKKDESGATFNTSEFLKEFSSFLEAGKIKELGLLSPIDKAAVTKTIKNGDTYTLEIADSLVKKYLNTMSANESGGKDKAIQIDKLTNFKYSATVSNGIVTKVSYSGNVAVTVPANLMASGEAAAYDLVFSVDVSFNNPGSAVTVTLPSTEGFEEI